MDGSNSRALLNLHWGVLWRDVEVAGEALWHAVTRAWCLFDAIPHAAFAHRMEAHRKQWRPDLMPPDARVACEAMPDPVRIYRGQSATPGRRLGLSWALDPNVAQRFAEGHRGTRNQNPTVFCIEVPKSAIAFAVVDRDEAETVLFAVPPRHAVRVM